MLAENVGCATDVVPLRMREHEQRQLADAEAAELPSHVRLGWALVDEQRASRNLDERRVALADVEKRHAQPRRWRQAPGSGAARHAIATSPAAATATASVLDLLPRTIDGRQTRCHQQYGRGRELRVRDRGDCPGAEHEIRREPAVQPDEQRSDVRDDRVDRCCEQAEPEQRRDHGRRHRVGDHGVRRHGAELEEQDRGRCDPARDRYGDDRCRRTRQRVSLQPTHQARHEREDGGDGRKRELKAGVEQVVRVPREEHEGAEEQEPPAIPLAGTHPREGREPARDSGPYHRRLRADGEHVRADRRERPDLARHPRDTEQPGDEQHAARDERDVLTRDGEQVVEARGTERVTQVFVQPFVLPEHDPEQHGTPLAGDARRERGGDRSPEPVGDAAEASPATDDLWIATSQDDVYAVTPEPGALVEAVLAGPRLGHEDRELEDRALRRRPAHG